MDVRDHGCGVKLNSRGSKLLRRAEGTLSAFFVGLRFGSDEKAKGPVGDEAFSKIS